MKIGQYSCPLCDPPAPHRPDPGTARLNLSVHRKLQFFHCRDCGASGDCIEWVRQLGNLDFSTAMIACMNRIAPVRQ